MIDWCLQKQLAQVQEDHHHSHHHEDPTHLEAPIAAAVEETEIVSIPEPVDPLVPHQPEEGPLLQSVLAQMPPQAVAPHPLLSGAKALVVSICSFNAQLWCWLQVVCCHKILL